MSKTLRSGAAALLLLAAPAVVVALRLTRADALPSPLPTHWGADGHVDGTTSLGTLTSGVLVVTVLAAALGLGLLALRHRRTVAPEATVLAGWIAWLFTAVYAQVLLGAEGAATAAEVELDWLAVTAVVLVPTGLAALLWRLLPRTAETATSEPPASPLTLREDERVVWVGRAASRALLLTGTVLALAGSVVALRVSLQGLTLVGVGLLLVLMHALTVRVDREAVTVRWGVLPFLRHRLRLETLAGARAETVDPLGWGGWGYRVSTRGRAAVVRRGPGLVLTRTDGREFAVTVDRPEGAADLVNALVAARRESALDAH